MLQDYGLDMLRGNFLCSIGLIKENHHFLILMVDFQAVIKLFDVENSTLTHASLLVLRNDNIWWQPKPLPDIGCTIVKTFRKLENQMRPDKTF